MHVCLSFFLTYLHTYMHAYIHAYIHTLHTYTHTYIQTDRQTYIHTAWMLADVGPRKLGEDKTIYQGPKAAYTDQYSSIGAVERWRVPRSTTTLTWVDGAISRLFTTLSDDLVTPSTLNQLRERFSPAMHIETTGNKSHMWSAQTTMSFLKFLSVDARLNVLICTS